MILNEEESSFQNCFSFFFYMHDHYRYGRGTMTVNEDRIFLGVTVMGTFGRNQAKFSKNFENMYLC